MKDESSRLIPSRKRYERERRKVARRVDSLLRRMERHLAFMREWLRLLRVEDLPTLREMQARTDYKTLQDVRRRFLELDDHVDKAAKELNRLDEVLRKGIVCPGCKGLGDLPTERRYDRSDGQIRAYAKWTRCPLCHGIGRMQLKP